MISLAKAFFSNIGYALFIAILLLLDTTVAETCGSPVIQVLLCVYIVTLAKPRRYIPKALFIAALAAESLIFFSHVSYGLIIALFMLLIAPILRAWFHYEIIANITGISIALTAQHLLIASHIPNTKVDFFMLIGHIFINSILLSIYWIFDKNGKQGNRS